MPDHIHIGAGSFGLGMVVEICKRAGFKTTILNRQSTREHHEVLRRDEKYDVVFDGNSAKRQTISAQLHYYDGDSDCAAVALLGDPAVRLITTSVKKENLPQIARLLLRGLEKRAKNGSISPLCILACENFQHNSAKLRQQVEMQMGKKDHYKRNKDLFKEVFFCNTLVDRICATISCRNKTVEVPAESFYSWIVNDPGQKAPGLEKLSSSRLIRLVDNLEFNGHETQKYWCMNGLHLAAAAYAYNLDPNLKYFHNVLAVQEIREKIQALQEELGLAFLLYVSNNGLQERFSIDMVEKYNKTVFRRLKSNHTDTISRVLKQQGPRERGVLETLDRIERLLGPQCEIEARRKKLVKPKYEHVALHWNEKEFGRLELDDAITQVVFALRNFSAEYTDI